MDWRRFERDSLLRSKDVTALTAIKCQCGSTLDFGRCLLFTNSNKCRMGSRCEDMFDRMAYWKVIQPTISVIVTVSYVSVMFF